ncbi:hypothetical protein FA13DRAFT_1094436 [Coprinellus micaceus]|uniref:Uncharacterized protein n=1 Tax=Coprinellus micaceus TaxID=71717 RepID=A0A4Y7TS98_COPMI|nr:hypothetical protein FA13DRAFT_1094436 [Coprinellus micaceus]
MSRRRPSYALEPRGHPRRFWAQARPTDEIPKTSRWTGGRGPVLSSHRVVDVRRYANFIDFTHVPGLSSSVPPSPSHPTHPQERLRRPHPPLASPFRLPPRPTFIPPSTAHSRSSPFTVRPRSPSFTAPPRKSSRAIAIAEVVGPGSSSKSGLLLSRVGFAFDDGGKASTRGRVQVEEDWYSTDGPALGRGG